jgi:hypothetical protein
MATPLTVQDLLTQLLECHPDARVYFDSPDDEGVITGISQIIPKPWGGYVTLEGTHE